MYFIIPIHWNIKSAPASPGRSRAEPAFYVFSFLGSSFILIQTLQLYCTMCTICTMCLCTTITCLRCMERDGAWQQGEHHASGGGRLQSHGEPLPRYLVCWPLKELSHEIKMVPMWLDGYNLWALIVFKALSCFLALNLTLKFKVVPWHVNGATSGIISEYSCTFAILW